MSVRNLEQEIKRRVKLAIEGIQVVDIEGNTAVPIVETGVPSLEKLKGKPYILIQTTNISDSNTESEASVLLIYGTVGMSKKDRIDSEKKEYIHSTGHWDVISIIDKIRSNFLKDTNFNFGVLNREMKHEVFGQIEDVNYLGESKLKFTIATIMPQDDYY